jgi:uncharacterized protein (TIGR03032 family)
MSPWEQESMLVAFVEDLSRSEQGSTGQAAKLETMLERFHRQWRALWARFGPDEPGFPAFRQLLDQLDVSLKPFENRLTLPNSVDAVEMLRQAVVRPALNPELAPHGKSQMADLAPMAPPPSPSPSPPGTVGSRPSPITRPIFIVAAPRSGSTLLFETLARSPSVWTIGGESHEVFEKIAKLSPVERGFDSNRLTAADADPQTAEALRSGFLGLLRDRTGRALGRETAAVRLLEKTPKNALRIPFLHAVFPDALFIYLYREPRENLSSIMDAWKSGKFVTYPQLPKWKGLPWSLLLIPEWERLRGKSLPEIAAKQWSSSHRYILDDLARLPADRWCTVTYADLLAHPQAEAERLCRFAGIGWDQELSGPLPLSRHTLAPPAPDKWRKHAAELEKVLPKIAAVDARVRQAVAAKAPVHSPPQVHRAALVQQNGSKEPASRPIVLAPSLPAKETNMTSPPPPDQNGQPSELRSVHTSNLPQLLDQFGISLLVSTYQAGKLIVVRVDDGKLNTHFRSFVQPMGMAVQGNRLAIGTKLQVWELCNQPEVGRNLEPAGRHDACFLPRACHVTGDIRIHEIAWADEELWIVNTRFSCLCTLDRNHSFVPRWRPPFVSGLAPEDRCHLNGLAMIDGQPRYVTVLGETDTAAGWRANKANGGCLIDVLSGETLVRGLSMPHSPRWYDDKLWLLESGTGSISLVDLNAGRAEEIGQVPGFTRGIDFCGPYAFVGLSQVRESAVFSGLPITQRLQERTCGVWVVDLRNGQTVGFLRFESGVQEIFAVQVLHGIRFPEIAMDNEDVIANSFVLPDEALADVR